LLEATDSTAVDLGDGSKIRRVCANFLPRWGTLIPIGEGIAAIGCGAGGSIYDLVRVSD